MNSLLEELGLIDSEDIESLGGAITRPVIQDVPDVLKNVTCPCGNVMDTDTPYFERVRTVVVPARCPECDLITLVKNFQEYEVAL